MVDRAAVGAQQLLEILVAHGLSGMSGYGTGSQRASARRSRGFAGRRGQRGQVDAFLHGGGVLAHQRLGARALAVLQRIDDAVVLAVRVLQHVVHLLEIVLVEGQRLGAGEGHAAVAFERLGDDRAASLLEHQPMEALVHFRVQRLVALHDATLAEQRIAILQAGTQLAQQRPGRTALGDAPGCKALEHGADVDRVDDVGGGECAHDVAARRVLGQQALLRQQRQRLAHRRARHAQQVGERRLGDALTRRELAAKDHLADADDSLRKVGAHGAGMLPAGSRNVNLGSHNP